MTVFRRLAAAVAVVLAATVAQAQTDQGKISGTVRDQTNAFVAGAKVTVRNERTGETRSAESNGQGYFLIGYLKPSCRRTSPSPEQRRCWT